MGTQRDRQADTRFKGNDLLLPLLLTPHFATAGQEKPDFFDCAMGDSR
jgi:hypothetical protein